MNKNRKGELKIEQNKKYEIVYADPPWQYKVYSDKGKGRSAESHYQTMKIEDICNLPVRNITAPNSVLFMWVTFPTLLDGLKVIEKWGFKYKTIAFVWIKQNKKTPSLFWGMGFWTRANAEICVLAVKGKPKRISAKVHQVIISPIEEHSKKPDETRKRIVELLGDLSKIELFARKKANGWDVWGNEVESDIDLLEYQNKREVVEVEQ